MTVLWKINPPKETTPLSLNHLCIYNALNRFREFLIFVSLNCWFIEFLIYMFFFILRTDDRKKQLLYFVLPFKKKIVNHNWLCLHEMCCTYKVVLPCLALTTGSVWVSQQWHCSGVCHPKLSVFNDLSTRITYQSRCVHEQQLTNLTYSAFNLGPTSAGTDLC